MNIPYFFLALIVKTLDEAAKSLFPHCHPFWDTQRYVSFPWKSEMNPHKWQILSMWSHYQIRQSSSTIQIKGSSKWDFVKSSLTYSNMHLVEFSIHLLIVFTRLALKNTTKYTYDPQTPHTKYWSLFILRWQGAPRVTKVGANTPIAFFLTIPSTTLHFLNYLPFPKR